MRIAFIAMSGVRAWDTELLALGLSMPGFVERKAVIAQLPSLGLLTLAGLTPDLALTVPWWRVINAAGRISNQFNATLQRELLEAEGIVFDERGYVDLGMCLWDAG